MHQWFTFPDQSESTWFSGKLANANTGAEVLRKLNVLKCLISFVRTSGFFIFSGHSIA